MALPNTSSYQTTDGNIGQIITGVMGDPNAATSTATLTAAQVVGTLVANPGTSAASYTLPATSAVEALFSDVKLNMTFETVIINLGTSSGAITIVAGTGWTLVGSATIAIGTSARVRARRTGITNGVAQWTLYRIA